MTCGLFSLLCFKLLYMALVLVLRGCLVSTPLDCVVFGGQVVVLPCRIRIRVQGVYVSDVLCWSVRDEPSHLGRHKPGCRPAGCHQQCCLSEAALLVLKFAQVLVHASAFGLCTGVCTARIGPWCNTR